MTVTQAPLDIYLAGPRGFCAGVDRAIKIVEKAIDIYGAPVYVRHEIVHNRHVVESLMARGAVFVEELTDIPDLSRPVIFSAHGVAKSVPEMAIAKNMIYIDATCPLVTKVHREVEHLHADGYHILLIGHAGHPEVIGTIGQLPAGAIDLIETADDARNITPKYCDKLAYATQTTLSVDDTAGMIAILKSRFPHIVGPRKDDICYATTNRQQAVKAIAQKCDAVIVMGAPNSSNSVRLAEVAQKSGCTKSLLLQSAADMDWALLNGVRNLGISAGASAPEILVDELIAECKKRYQVTIHEVVVAHEDIEFKLPKMGTGAHVTANTGT